MTGTVVLLHGLTDSAGCWADAEALWTASGLAVLAVDARGHGRAPRFTDSELTERPGAVMVRDVVALIEHLPRPVVLLGHSMGAAVAVAAAASVPSRVAGVVAEDPPWPVPPRTAADAGRAAEWVRDHDRNQLLSHAQRVSWGRVVSPDWSGAELDAWSRAKEQTDRRLLATGDIVPPLPWPELLSRIRDRVPVLVVTGDQDVMVGRESEREASRRGATVVRLAGAGHSVRRDAPDAYHAVVDPFLRALTVDD